MRSVNRGRSFWRRRIKRPLQKRQWQLVVALWVVAFGLGVWGYSVSPAGPHWMPQVVYLALHLFTFKGGEDFGWVNWQLEIARFLAPAIAAYTAGKGLVALFYDQLQGVRSRFMRDHIIVCGLSDKGRLIARSFLDRGDRVVMIERDSDRGKVSIPRSEGAVVLSGDATDASMLLAAGARRARYLIATCGDGANSEILVQAHALRVPKDGHLDCLVHASEAAIIDSLHDLSDRLASPGVFGVRFFNVLQAGARAMVTECPAFALMDDGGAPPAVVIQGDDSLVQFVVGEIVLRWAMRVGLSGPKLKLILLGPTEASDDASVARLRESLVDVASVPDVASLPDDVSAVYILDSDPEAATVLAMEAQEALPPTALIAVRFQRYAGLARLLDHARAGASRANLRVFPLYERACSTPDLLLDAQREVLGQAIHRRYSAEIASAPGWDQLPEAYRESSRDQADWIFRILADRGFLAVESTDRKRITIEFSECEVEELARLEHGRWCAERWAAGWIHRDRRDDERKHHPDLVPWVELPEEVREYDRKFVRHWPSMLSDPEIGFTVRRCASRGLASADDLAREPDEKVAS